MYKRLARADSVTTSIGVSTLAIVLSRGVGLLRGVVLAWLIPAEQFGLLGVALLVANVLMPICSAGLYEGAARYAPFHESTGTLRRFAVRVFTLVVGSTLITGAIVALAAGPVGSVLLAAGRIASGVEGAVEGGPQTILLTRAVIVCVIALACHHTLLGLFKGLRMFRAVGAVELFSAAMFTLLAVGGAVCGYTTAYAVMWGYAISCLLSIVVFAPCLVVRVRSCEGEPRDRPAREPLGLVRFSVWAGGTALMFHLLSYYPMWYLLKVSDGETVGAFHAVRIIAQLVQVAAALLTAVVAADVNRLWEQHGPDSAGPRLELLTKVTVLAVLVGAVVLSLFKPFIGRIFPATLASGIVAYEPLVLFFLLVGLVGLVAVRLNVIEKPRWVFAAWVAGAVVNVAASFLLIGTGSETTGATRADVLQAAAWAGVIGVTASLILCVALAGRTTVRLGVGTVVLLAVCYTIGLGWAVALPVVVVVLLIATTTPILFSHEDRGQMTARLSRFLGR